MTIEETKSLVAEVIGGPNALGYYAISKEAFDSAIQLAHAAGGMEQAQKTMVRFTHDPESAYRKSINADVPVPEFPINREYMATAKNEAV